MPWPFEGQLVARAGQQLLSSFDSTMDLHYSFYVNHSIFEGMSTCSALRIGAFLKEEHLI